MVNWLLSPPIVLLLMICFLLVLSRLLAVFAIKVDDRTAGGGEPYACGESDYNAMAQPDYSQFFPFAFFFTIAHMATMVVASTPLETKSTLVIVLTYIFAVVVGLFILLGRDA